MSITYSLIVISNFPESSWEEPCYKDCRPDEDDE